MLNERDFGKLKLIIDYCDYIEKILKRINNNIDIFKNDFEAQQSISFDIIQIGEAINILSQETKDKYQEIYWHKIIGMRNIIVHKYGAVDYEILFESAYSSIPELKKYCQKIIKQEKQNYT